MTDADLLGEAVIELYTAEPESFTERRSALVAQARAAGAGETAKRIAGLRKPTRSAWLVNRLVRADPSVPAQLSELGAELRAAQAALDGARIRELSAARRRLIDDLVRQAFQLAGQQAPPAVLREELTATFNAALADPEVTRQLAAGTLLRAAQRADFSPGGPVLALVPPLADGSGPTAAPVTPARRPGKRAATARTAAPGGAPDAKSAAAARTAEQAAAERRAEAERRHAQAEAERRRALAEAEQALADATMAADTAATAEREQRDSVRALQQQLAEVRQQLADAQQRLADARAQTRQADSTRHKASRALDRLLRLGGPA